MKKKIVGFIFCMLVSTAAIYPIAVAIQKEKSTLDSTDIWTYTVEFSPPEFIDGDEGIHLNVKEANSYVTIPGEPMLPIHSVVTTFPLGTHIIDVTCVYSEPKAIQLSKQLVSAPQLHRVDQSFSSRTTEGEYVIDGSDEAYTHAWFGYRSGGGISKGKHVTFLSLHVYPVRLQVDENIVQWIDHAEFMVTVAYPQESFIATEDYSLVILTPSGFASLVQPLVEHKNKYGLSTKLVTLDELYRGDYFPVHGEDDAEKIKYFIRDAVEGWGTTFILLVGNTYKVPIRKTWLANMDVLTDLYYADLYFGDGSFCSWDSNGNGYYGEYLHNDKTDDVDLYPDIYIGRLACANKGEVRTVINKIIHYEENTYGETWFDTMVLCGGDTHPGWSVNEGEVVIDEIAATMSGFSHIKLRTSDDTFTSTSLNTALSNGAGFFAYSGHGFGHGMGTHPPNDQTWIYYFTSHLLGLRNRNKLPIVFFGACLTAHLDQTLGDILWYLLGDILHLQRVPNIQIPIPCFAWCWVRKPDGGAIATIGATRIAYSMVDESGIHGGCSYLSLHFFKGYDPNGNVAEMLVSSQNDYLNHVWKDPLTVEEYVLLGDPSLKIGGYPGGSI